MLTALALHLSATQGEKDVFPVAVRNGVGVFLVFVILVVAVTRLNRDR
jgi:hypothetical protein